MLKVVLSRVRQGHRTVSFPKGEPALPERFRGRPAIDSTRCSPGCHECVQACPTSAIALEPAGIKLDLGRCLFCGECERACRQEAIHFTREYRLAASHRQKLVLRGAEQDLAKALAAASRRMFGHSLKLRQVSAGGCNACEADVNVLSTVVFDLGRFGVQFVASPRHADGLLITGPVTRNMQSALKKTYDAVPAPKVVIAVGACAISAGLFLGNPEVCQGASSVVPVDLFIPGCPPHPVTILDGLLRWLGRLRQDTLSEATPCGGELRV